ncbi:hypothetical protein BURMUCGD1_4626 [Burkholderia multivorans CGD1]|nr:hypothetical protein BURMUCGD1_4626 [Burkholderia multivorans CGD1]
MAETARKRRPDGPPSARDDAHTARMLRTHMRRRHDGFWLA